MTENHTQNGEQPPEKEAAEQTEKDNLENKESAEPAAGAAEENEDSTNINPADEAAKPENDSAEASDGDPPAAEEIQAVEDFDLNLLLDIPLEITVELGRSRVRIQELLELTPGSTVSLTKLEGDPVDILANDKLIARGEVVLQNKKYGIRITEITSRMNRIKSLN